MGLSLITAATAYPVTLAEAKLHCRVDGAAEDALLNSYIAAATELTEQHTGRLLKAQTWALYLDEFSDTIELPKGPVSAVSHVKYLDEVGVLQTLSADVYTVDLISDPQWIVRNADESWPAVQDIVNAVKITFVAGYATVPEPIRLAILSAVTNWYENRSMSGLPAGVLAGLSPYRRMVI